MINISSSKIDLVSQVLSGVKNGTEKALTRSINRTLVGARTQLSRSIRDRYFIKNSDITAAVAMNKASLSNLNGGLNAQGIRQRLIKFNVNPKSPRRVSMVSAGVFANGRKALKGAFVQRMKNGTIGVFHRRAGGRYPIDQLYSLSVPQMMNQVLLHSSDLEQYANQRFDKELDHEVMRLMKGYGK